MYSRKSIFGLLTGMALVCGGITAMAQQTGKVVIHGDPRLQALSKRHIEELFAPAEKNNEADNPKTETKVADAPAPEKVKKGVEKSTVAEPKTPTGKPTAKVATISNTKTFVSAEPNTPYKGKGFRVQLYSGPDRAKANEIKAVFNKKFPGVRSYLVYIAPSFRVKAGDFRSRHEAERLLKMAKPINNVMMIVPDDIAVTGAATSAVTQ